MRCRGLIVASFVLNVFAWLCSKTCGLAHTPDIDYKELVKHTDLKQPTFSSRPNRKADRKKEGEGGGGVGAIL